MYGSGIRVLSRDLEAEESEHAHSKSVILGGRQLQPKTLVSMSYKTTSIRPILFVSGCIGQHHSERSERSVSCDFVMKSSDVGQYELVVVRSFLVVTFVHAVDPWNGAISIEHEELIGSGTYQQYRSVERIRVSLT